MIEGALRDVDSHKCVPMRVDRLTLNALGLTWCKVGQLDSILYSLSLRLQKCVVAPAEQFEVRLGLLSV